MLDIEISQASAVIAPATRFLLAWWMLCWLYTCFALHKILCIVYFCWHSILLHFYFYLFLVLNPLPYLHYHFLYIINYLPFSTTSLAWSEIFNQVILRYYYPTHFFNYPPSLNHSFTPQPWKQQLLPPPVKPLSRQSLPELFRDRCEHLQAGTSGPESPGRWPLVKTLSVWRTAVTLKGTDTPPKARPAHAQR